MTSIAMSRRLIGIAAMLAVSLFPQSILAESVVDIAVPKGVETRTLFQPGTTADKPLNSAFDIDPDGLPTIADGTSLRLLGSAQELLTLGVLPIDDFAWMRDNRLLLVTQNHLASLSPKGVALGLALPGSGMRLRPAGENTAYVFGGTTDPTNRNVYLLARDQTVAKLASLPQAVTAVAGDGVTSYVSNGKTILRIALNQPPRILLETRDPITSLEISSRNGLFYSTKSSVGYIDSNGDASEFIRGEGGQLRLRGSMLYVLMTSGNLFRFGPVEAFEQSKK